MTTSDSPASTGSSTEEPRPVESPSDFSHRAGSRSSNHLGLTLYMPFVALAVSVIGTWIAANRASKARLEALLARGEVREARQRIDSLASMLLFDEETVSEKLVDLHDSQLQDIGSGFSAGNFALTSEPGGVRLSGVLVNRESVGHQSASFQIRIGHVRREFTVMKLRAGGSSPFSVSLPGVNPDSVRVGVLQYQGSTVSYSAQ